MYFLDNKVMSAMIGNTANIKDNTVQNKIPEAGENKSIMVFILFTHNQI